MKFNFCIDTSLSHWHRSKSAHRWYLVLEHCKKNRNTLRHENESDVLTPDVVGHVSALRVNEGREHVPRVFTAHDLHVPAGDRGGGGGVGWGRVDLIGVLFVRLTQVDD